VLFAAGAAVVLAPWIVRNLRVTGRPMFDLHAYTESQRMMWKGKGAAYRPHRLTEVTTSAALVSRSPRRVALHAWKGIANAARGLPAYAGPGFVALLAVGLFVTPPAGLARDLRYLPHIAAGLLAVLLSPVTMTSRYFIPLVPLVAACGAAALVEWGSRVGNAASAARPRGRVRLALSRAAFAAVVATIALPAAARLAVAARAAASGHLGRFWPPPTENLRARTSADHVIASDDMSIAWYARRKVIWLPWDDAAIRDVDSVFPIDAVFLRDGDARIDDVLGPITREAIGRFVAGEFEPAGVERDGTGRLFVRRAH
jgi:hypothetical protein